MRTVRVVSSSRSRFRMLMAVLVLLTVLQAFHIFYFPLRYESLMQVNVTSLGAMPSGSWANWLNLEIPRAHSMPEMPGNVKAPRVHSMPEMPGIATKSLYSDSTNHTTKPTRKSASRVGKELWKFKTGIKLSKENKFNPSNETIKNIGETMNVHDLPSSVSKLPPWGHQEELSITNKEKPDMTVAISKEKETALYKISDSCEMDNGFEQSHTLLGDIAALPSGIDSGARTQSKALCPVTPPNLRGRLKVQRTSPTLQEQEHNHPELELGGHYTPAECRARHKVAIIIPYRNRETHLALFLNHTHPILQRQQIDYTIYVVEQAVSGNDKFNRAMLLNVGALEALKLYKHDCFIFHDVDLLSEDDRNLYTCPDQPRHLSTAVDTFKYRLPYEMLFGGVRGLSVDHFRTVNGFSNKFWGWGGEDDDMANRLIYHGFFISRSPKITGRYTMLSHTKEKPNKERYRFLHEGKKRFNTDGINSIKYQVLDIQRRRLYTWIYVHLCPS